MECDPFEVGLGSVYNPVKYFAEMGHGKKEQVLLPCLYVVLFQLYPCIILTK